MRLKSNLIGHSMRASNGVQESRGKLLIVRSLLLILILTVWALGGYYETGDTVSPDHQNIPYTICYGEYPTDNLQLSDFNGYQNGGDFNIIWIEMLATW